MHVDCNSILHSSLTKAYLTLPQESSLALGLADDETTVVEAGTVLLQPSRDETLVRLRQQMSELPV